MDLRSVDARRAPKSLAADEKSPAPRGLWSESQTPFRGGVAWMT